jgi:predicted dehydrogenase
VDHVGADYRRFLDAVDLVDIVTPSTSHFALCCDALQAGKDVFVEKPMTMTSEEALELAALVGETGKRIQVGYYYRFHPISRYLKRQIQEHSLGPLRYLSGNFMGFKRARTDVGVTHTDAIHFFDLFNWFVGAPPTEVYAVTRDHFHRGMEDFSVVLLEYPNGTLAKVESGYIQPGRWRDKVVPEAWTTKEIFVCGGRASADADFETEQLAFHKVHHEFRNGTWRPVSAGAELANLGTSSPIQMLCDELMEFLDCVRHRHRPSANVVASGVVLARLMEGVYASADRKHPIALHWNQEEIASLE